MRPNILIAHDKSCLKIEISYPTDNSVGFLSFTMANREGEEYDAASEIRVNLGVFDMARVQQVLLGECESLDLTIDGTKFLMRHLVNPSVGYAIGVANGDRRCQTFLEPCEALAVSEAISTSFFFVSFVKGVS